jgi:ribosomal protein L11 methyltransferase
MEKIWIEMRIRVPGTAVDLVCHELAELGCDGVTVEERQLDTFIPPDPDESPPEEYFIKAYYAVSGESESLRRLIKERLEWLAGFVPGLIPALHEVREVRKEDWAEGWKQHFQAVRLGPRLVVKPSWEDFFPAPGDVVVNLDPGMAFGTGTHGTTRLCLEALAGLFEHSPVPKRVLDVGTGSGILAIAAAALGAERVLACDIEPDSCRIAAENARLNAVEKRVELTGEPLQELEGEFDVVLANILAEENIRLASELVGRVTPGGALILSGILLEKEKLVREAFSAFPLSEPEITCREEWICLLYRRER